MEPLSVSSQLLPFASFLGLARGLLLCLGGLRGRRLDPRLQFWNLVAYNLQHCSPSFVLGHEEAAVLVAELYSDPSADFWVSVIQFSGIDLVLNPDAESRGQ